MAWKENAHHLFSTKLRELRHEMSKLAHQVAKDHLRLAFMKCREQSLVEVVDKYAKQPQTTCLHTYKCTKCHHEWQDTELIPCDWCGASGYKLS